MSYENGKIYKITNNQTNDIYVGSTIRTLGQRWSNHKTKMKNEDELADLYVYMNVFGVDNFTIELIEDYPCNCKEDLREREQIWINELNPTLNKQDAFSGIESGLSRADYNQLYHIENRVEILKKQKIYYNKNKEKLLKQRKEHYELNREEVLEKQREYNAEHKEERADYDRVRYIQNREEMLERVRDYREQHPEKVLETNRKSRERNKEKIAACKAEKITCGVCRKQITRNHLARHERSEFHINALDSRNQ